MPRIPPLPRAALGAILALLLAVASFGCGPEGAVISLVALSSPRSVSGIPHTYRPTRPRQASRPELRANLRQIAVGDTGLLVRLRLDAASELGLYRALLAPDAARPCQEGVRDRYFEIDGDKRWARPFRMTGSHDVVFWFPTGGALLDRPSSIDLVLGVGNEGLAFCLCVPLNSRDPGPLAERPPPVLWRKVGVVTTGGALRGFAPFEPVRGVGSGWSYEALFGFHLGPIRPQLEIGFGFARCRENCLDDPIGFLLVPFGTSFHWFLLDRDGVSVDLGLGSRFLYANVGVETTRSFWMYAPTLSLRLAGTVQHGVSLESGARVGSNGFELFLSRWSSPGFDASERSYVLGGAWAWDATW